MPSRHAIAAATLVATAVAFVQPAAPRHLIKLRAGDELPEVSPGEVDWDEEFKRLKRGEVGKAAKLNEVGLEVERTGRVAKRKASDAARSVQRGAARAANSMPRAPSLSKDAVFWFAVIAALAFLFATLPVRSTSSPTSFSFAALPTSPRFSRLNSSSQSTSPGLTSGSSSPARNLMRCRGAAGWTNATAVARSVAAAMAWRAGIVRVSHELESPKCVLRLLLQ